MTKINASEADKSIRISTMAELAQNPLRVQEVLGENHNEIGLSEAEVSTAVKLMNVFIERFQTVMQEKGPEMNIGVDSIPQPTLSIAVNNSASLTGLPIFPITYNPRTNVFEIVSRDLVASVRHMGSIGGFFPGSTARRSGQVLPDYETTMYGLFGDMGVMYAAQILLANEIQGQEYRETVLRWQNSYGAKNTDAARARTIAINKSAITLQRAEL